MQDVMKMENMDEETTRMAKRMVVVRISTKHINLWMRQLDMKRNEICELAELMGLEWIRNEIATEKCLEKWAKRACNHFTKKTRRMLFEEIDNMVWSGKEKEIVEWRLKNKVYDEITEVEIDEIWKKEDPSEEAPVRLNGKYVWETAKRVCDFINAHEDFIQIATFAEYKKVMKKVMSVIKEAHNVERKRRQVARKNQSEKSSKTIQKAKSLIANIRRGQLKKEEIERKLDTIFGKGSHEEIAKVMTTEKIAERIEEMAKREEQIEEWEKMRREAKRKQREDRRLNLFWRRNKTFPTQFEGDDETPDQDETLIFWRNINNKEITELWRCDESIQEVLREVREKVQRRCQWEAFTEWEFDEVLACTAPWKACGVDSVYSFPIKRCPPIKKAVYTLVKKMVEWKGTERWDEENNWLSKGGPSSFSRAATGKILLIAAPSPASQPSQRWSPLPSTRG